MTARNFAIPRLISFCSLACFTALAVVISTSGAQAETAAIAAAPPRAHSVGLSGSFSSLSASVTEDVTDSLTLTPKYGWNFGIWEFGPQASLTGTNSPASSSIGFTGGVFADWNFSTLR